MSSALCRTYELKLLAQDVLTHHCLLGSHQHPGLPLGREHTASLLLREPGLKYGTLYRQPQVSACTRPQATRASTLPRYLARGAAWAPPGPQAPVSALNQPCLYQSEETLQGKAAFCTAHGQQKLQGMPTRAHRVPVGVKAVLCEPAAGAVGSWAQTRAHGTRNDGAALSSMQLCADCGMRQLTVRVSLLHLQHWTPAADPMAFLRSSALPCTQLECKSRRKLSEHVART